MLRHLRRGVCNALRSSCITQHSVAVLEQAGLQNLSPLHCCSQQLLHSTPAFQAPVQVQNAPRPAWTPTAQLTKRKTLPKRMGYLLQSLEAEQVAAVEQTRQFPAFRPGDVLELKVAVPENRRKVATLKGIVIAKKNRGWQSAFTIRNHLGNAGGIERTFPLYSPSLLGMKVLESRNVNRAKLYYLRDRKPSEYRS